MLSNIPFFCRPLSSVARCLEYLMPELHAVSISFLDKFVFTCSCSNAGVAGRWSRLAGCQTKGYVSCQQNDIIVALLCLFVSRQLQIEQKIKAGWVLKKKGRRGEERGLIYLCVMFIEQRIFITEFCLNFRLMYDLRNEGCQILIFLFLLQEYWVLFKLFSY